MHTFSDMENRIDVENTDLDAIASIFDKSSSYCDSLRETHSALLSGNGPLPEPTRHFIARMVRNSPSLRPDIIILLNLIVLRAGL